MRNLFRFRLGVRPARVVLDRASRLLTGRRCAVESPFYNEDSANGDSGEEPVAAIPLNRNHLQRTIAGALKNVAHDHPGSIDRNFIGSVAKRAAGQLMSDTREPRKEAIALIEIKNRELKQLRREIYALRHGNIPESVLTS